MDFTGQIIKNPGFDAFKEKANQCLWIVKESSDNAVITIKSDVINMKEDLRCKTDYIKLYIPDASNNNWKQVSFIKHVYFF